jgi:2-octaprenyl-6-methoxyphenol hydroxylase
MSNNHYKSYKTDVLIVGSGMVGSCLAIALSSVGFKVILVDQVDPLVQTGNEFDGRASAIAATPQKMLEEIGIWRHLKNNFMPIKDIRVADSGSSLFLHYSHEDVLCEALGFMVENRHFRQACMAKISIDNNTTFIAPCKIQHLSRAAGGVHAVLTNGSHVEAGLVVGADGRGSKIRQIAGIKFTTWAYPQTAIVLTVDHAISHNNVAHEHFLPAGPFAILPLRGEQGTTNRSSIVWTEKSELAKIILKLPPVDFTNEFKRRFGEYLGDSTFIGPRGAYPLSLQFVETRISERLALIGDAAYGIHPIAGQGLNLGLRDVAALAEVLTDAKRLGLDIGSDTLLEKYQKWRRFDSAVMLATTDSLNRLFSNDIRPIKVARDLGLAAINKLDPVKKIFMQHAMGSTGDLPRLLKGQPL